MAELATPPINPHASPGSPARLKGVLSGMMFLQYFVQGAYLPVLTEYLASGLNFSPAQMGAIAAALAIGPLMAPFVVGQLVDRYFSTDRVLAAFHFACGALMIALYTQSSFWPILALGTIYSALYVPTTMLTNSLAFRHLPDREGDFPVIRLWGTVGFIVPAFFVEWVLLRGMSGEALDSARGVILLVSGIGSLVMAVYCLFLPHTPPVPVARPDLAPGKVLQLLRAVDFRVLVLVAFVIAIAHQYFFVWNSPFLRMLLRRGGITGAWEQQIAAIGQICEIAVMLVLGWMLRRYGFRRTLILGAAAYVLRCLILGTAAAWEGPFPAVMALVAFGQALHGACFGCFLAGAYIYVDRIAPADVRGSMQNVFGAFVVGSGLFVGGFVGGAIADAFSAESPQALRSRWGIESTAGVAPYEVKGPDGSVRIRQLDWAGVWFSGAAIAAVGLAGLAIAFPREPQGDSAIRNAESA